MKRSLSCMLSLALCCQQIFIFDTSLAAESQPIKQHSEQISPKQGVQLGKIIYPFDEKEREKPGYFLALLKLALDKQGAQYQLQGAQANMSQARTLNELAEGRELTLAVSMTSKEREALLLPIRIPIDKGLFGWRIFLIRANNQPSYDRVKNLHDLSKLSAGQGRDWPDTAVLRANALTVHTSKTSPQLQQMLLAGRIDYFPQSIIEIWDSQAQMNGLVVEKNLVLHYPTAFYFFTSKKNPLLAKTLEQGLRAALKDGSFDQLFMRFFGEAIAKANLSERTKIALQNPEMPESLPIDLLWRP